MHIYHGTPDTLAYKSKDRLGFESQAAACSAVSEASCQSLGFTPLVNAFGGLAGLYLHGYCRGR